MSPTLRAALAFASLSAWLVLLMSGLALGGAVYLLLAAALLLFPWRAARRPADRPVPPSDDPAPPTTTPPPRAGASPAPTPD